MMLSDRSAHTAWCVVKALQLENRIIVHLYARTHIAWEYLRRNNSCNFVLAISLPSLLLNKGKGEKRKKKGKKIKKEINE